MKLYLLERRETADLGEAKAMLIWAEHEVQARHIAGDHALDEQSDTWVLSYYTTCKEVTAPEHPGILMRDCKQY